MMIASPCPFRGSCATPSGMDLSNKITPHLAVTLDKTVINGLDRVGSADFYGLPPVVRQLYAEQRGVETLYDWQKECLSMTSVCSGSNLVYCLPTSGGKTLVAEVLMLQELLLRGRNVLFILPFVSIVQEKVRSLTAMGLELGFWVEEYAGSRGRVPPVKRRGSNSVLLATIEKAQSIVNALIDTKSLSDLGLVIVDELHMLGEGGSRGACLEMTLTKLRIVSPETRLIGMSATLSNISDLACFLDAELFTSTFRPVQLLEYVKIGDHVYELMSEKGLRNGPIQSVEEALANCLVHRRMVNFQYTKNMLSRDPDHVVGLVAETLMGYSMQDPNNTGGSPGRYSCLVFCPTKAHCENTARMLADLLPMAACFPAQAENLTQRRAQLLTSLRVDALPDQDLSVYSCCPVLEATVPKGVAYHHSGLTQEERSSLEEAFTDGTLSVLCCTSTLAAGVNLPARRVIIRKPYIGSAFMSGIQYKQIVGRAGRAGFDSVGESVTILQSMDRENFAQLISSIPRLRPRVSSSCASQPESSDDLCASSLLYENGKGMRQLLLSLVGLQIANTFCDIISAVEKTLFAIQASAAQPAIVERVVRAELLTLIKNDLLLITSENAFTHRSPVRLLQGDIGRLQFQATKLGRATVRGGLDTDLAGSLLSDLRIASRALNTSGPLHLLYLVAPPDVVDQIHVDWSVLYSRLDLLPPAQANIVSLLGFPEGYVLWKATGHPIRKKLDERPLRRLYVALALSELWQTSSTVPIWQVADRYKISRGSLQSLLASAAALASSLAHALASEYSTDEELWAFAHLLPEFATRLSYCVSSELLPLMELPGVKRGRARQLYSCGFCTLKDIASASPHDLTSRMSPFLSRRSATELIQSAKMLLSERADALRQEASDLLEGIGTRSVMSQLAHHLQFQSLPTETVLSSKSDSIGHNNSVSTFQEDDDLFA